MLLNEAHRKATNLPGALTMEFPSTSWTIIAAATLNGGNKERDALNSLCKNYWKPVSDYIRSRGAPSERIEDLTQDFFLQLMEKGFFKKADPAKGRFRTFILGSLRYFLADDVKRTMAQKKGGHLQRTELTDDIAATGSDDSYFDRAWAETIFEKVFTAIKKDTIEHRGKEGWEALRKFLPGKHTPPTYIELGEQLRLSEGGAKTEVFRLRKRFRESLRAEVGQTVEAPHEVDEELAHLRSALEKGATEL